jgi:peptidoglycan/LPS O-acetylase OafA/YrhL
MFSTSPTLASYTSSHRNNFAVLRLAAAWLVLYGHCYPLVLGTPEHPHIPDPISRALHNYLGFGQALSGMGLCIFFFVSGLLVTKSFVQRNNIVAFVRSRAARIYPALIVNLLFCISIISITVTTIPLKEYLFHSGIHGFFIDNLLFYHARFDLAGVFTANPWQAVNGSLWTLPLEVRMYGWVLAFGALGVLHHRASFNAMFLVAMGLYLIQGHGFFLAQAGTDFLWIYFLLGAFFYLNADNIRLNWRMFFALFLLTALLHGVENDGQRLYDLSFAITFSYGVLCFAYLRYLPKLDIGRVGDFSYGVYLYAYPIQQLIIYQSNNAVSPIELCALTTLIVAPLAVLSWYVIEKPALNRFR